MATALRSSCVFLFFFFLIYLPVGCAGSLLLHRLYFDCGYSRGAWASYCGGFSCCRVCIQYLSHMGLVALWHVGSSQIRDQTCVSCIGKQALYHRATEEVLFSIFSLCLVIAKL